MELVSLPAEIKLMIFAQLVTTIGIRQAALLRVVCTSFNDGILESIFSLPNLEREMDGSILNPSSQYARMGPKMTTKLILMNLRKATADRRPLAVAIESTLNWLREQIGHRPESTWSWCAQELASAAAYNLSVQDVVKGLVFDREETPGTNPNLTHALMGAVIKNENQLVAKILSRLSGHTTRSKYFGYPLVAAARSGNEKMISLLLQTEHASSTALSWQIFEALSTAASGGCIGSVQLLLLHIPYSLRQKSFYRIVIARSLESGHISVAQLLIREAPKPNNDSGYLKDTDFVFWKDLLQASIYSRKTSTVLFVLEHPDFVRSCGQLDRPLEISSRLGLLHVVELILFYSTPFTLQNCAGAVYWAARHKKIKILSKILEYILAYETLSRADALLDALSGAFASNSTQILNFVLIKAGLCDSELPQDLNNLTFPELVDKCDFQSFETGCSSAQCRSNRESRELDSLRLLADSPESSVYNYFDMSEFRYEVGLLDAACRSGQIYLFKHILSRWRTQNPGSSIRPFIVCVSTAAACERPGVLLYLLEHLPRDLLDSNTFNARSKTTCTFQIYLDYGLGVDEESHGIQRPDIGAAVEDPYLVDWLLDQGADPRGSNHYPLWFAAKQGYLSSLQLLIKRGADIFSPTQLLVCAVHCRDEHEAIIMLGLLLDCGLDIDAPPPRKNTGSGIEDDLNRWRTPLHIAVVLGRGEVVKYLLKRGSDPNIVDRTGKTALQFAEARGFIEIMGLLQNR